MSNISASEGMTFSQTVTAFFDSRSDADAAIERIVAAGVSRSAIKIVDGAETSTSPATTAPIHERSFFESLGDFFMPDEDRHSYAEGLRRGGYLVSVPTTVGNRDAILDILDDEGTVDMDKREASWKSEGWSGTETGYVAPVRTESAMAVGSAGSTESSARTEDSAARRSAHLGTAADRDGTIEVMEENLKVGKRDVSHGRVRVRSYVVEEAVSQDVNLRSERIDIQRRVVDRPVASFDDAFKDQTIELEETAEEAVVSKTARVVEEIDLAKHVSDRTETVSDTVRRTEVDIQDERTGKLRTDEGLTAEERARRGV
ncbi:YsnF/AvaK domain-containing protein [Aureimonas sp. AU40]|uniref:YsnF/AvaK domain-containing protein n=1 Tax=Aureimonas sp. AU40 TaxID=1637747 RepID=UPI000A7EC616|nr:YsnF/AvaK domain-containing protein [Aureimonas sp. AU40]